ncbi:transposase [Desulfitobacterium dichloroeliminans LMG P-21439]|uniref:Transposase n=1 Tax=Desulfitobacterium dichloroeliminans (strain LMG P-21439 / DCA1) TaxID=871963 RepID=L0F689_DESDL|nr:transposase [Desulfitobacterium dichloroeliminans]AGA68161.1 transposase [Desulfitobacterium dichloroeliminans LMG P-21439]
MMKEEKQKQNRMLCVFMENLVPKGHFLRRLDAAINFSFIYDIMRPLYSDKGRPSIDPIVLVKMLLIGYLYGIDSERRLEQEIIVNNAYRWFLGLDLEDKVPDHSVFSQNRRRRFKDTEVFREIFTTVVERCAEAGLIGGECVVMDSTHLKANAANGHAEKVILMEGPSDYWLKLNDEHGGHIQQKSEAADITSTVKKKSLADPEAGWMHRHPKPAGFHYLCHQSSDIRYGIVTDVHVTPGDVTDAPYCVERIAYQKKELRLPFRYAGLDSGYDTVAVHHGLHQLGVRAYIPINPGHTAHWRKERGLFAIEDFHYDALNDCYICPNGCTLRYIGVRKVRYRVGKNYVTRSEDCKNCPLKSQCIAGKANYKEVRRDFYQEDQERHHALVGTALYRYIMRKRQIICEGNFALQKRCHNLRFTRKRGIEKVQEQCLFSAMALNLKRLVKYGAAPLRPAVAYPRVGLMMLGLQKNLSVNFANCP